MLRTLIVDDEMIMRVGLISCIKWEDFGYQVVGSCESGEEALAQLDSLQPDVVFTDIKMPGMDGLELVQYIRQHYPKIKIVVLSCLNEIDYVKQAIKLGAEDYILKLSLTPQTLIDLLQELREKIMQARHTPEESGGMEVFQREQAYRMLLSKSVFPQQREKLLEQLGYAGQEAAEHIVCCCLVDDWEHTRRRSNLREGYLMTYALLNVLREFLADAPFAEAVSISEWEYLVVMRAAPGKDLKRDILTLGNSLNEALRTHLNTTLSFGVADPFRDYRQLPQRYETARFLAELRFFSGWRSVITEECMAASGSHAPAKGFPQLLQRAIDSQDVEAARLLVGDWFDQVAADAGSLLPQAVRTTVIQAWLYVSGTNDSSLCEMSEAPQDDDLFDALWHAETLSQLRARLLSAMEGLLEILAENRSGHPAIAAFRRHLVEHVGENISLGEAAAHCCLSKTYFCTLFKKETGESFVDYFSRLKMEKAHHLLQAGNIKVYEAGNAVGITDMSYFNKLFRKYYNCSPGQVKAQQRQAEYSPTKS